MSIASDRLKNVRAPPRLPIVFVDVFPHDLQCGNLSEPTQNNRYRGGPNMRELYSRKGSHISGLLRASAAGPKQGFHCSRALLSLCVRCPCRVVSSRTGVLAELLMEGRSTPALAPPSAAYTRKSESLDAWTISTLERAQIEPLEKPRLSVRAFIRRET